VPRSNNIGRNYVQGQIRESKSIGCYATSAQNTDYRTGDTIG